MIWTRGQGSLSSNDHRDKFWGFGWLHSLRGQRGGRGGKEVGQEKPLRWWGNGRHRVEVLLLGVPRNTLGQVCRAPPLQQPDGGAETLAL